MPHSRSRQLQMGANMPHYPCGITYSTNLPAVTLTTCFHMATTLRSKTTLSSLLSSPFLFPSFLLVSSIKKKHTTSQRILVLGHWLDPAGIPCEVIKSSCEPRRQENILIRCGEERRLQSALVSLIDRLFKKPLKKTGQLETNQLGFGVTGTSLSSAKRF